MDDVYDVVVVGGGAAGMSGAKIMARMRRRVLVAAGEPCNAPAHGVHDSLYAEGAAPADLAERGRAEARSYGVDVVTTVGVRRLLLTTGLVDVLPDVDGLVERWGTDVLHCPFCHGWEVRGQAVGVLGSGPLSVHQVLLFRQLSEDVVYFQHTAPDLTEEQAEQLAALGVEHVVGAVAAVETTDGALSGVRLADGRLLARQAVGLGTFLAGREDLVADLGLQTADLEMAGTVLGRYLPADPTGLTVTPGVWAAGNVAAPIAQVVSSAAAGAGAGSAMHMDMVAEDVAVAVVAHRERAAMVVSTDGPLPGPNAVLVDVTAALAPGTALDLGSGQGGDAFWLARQDWDVTTVDVSPTALVRVVERAAAAGLSEGIRVQKHDLSATFPQGVFDLVTAQYLHSPVEMDRAAVLRRAVAAVGPGGMSLVVDHASVHPWSWADPATVFPPRQTVESLELDPDVWQVVTAEDRDRQADGPGGQRATVTDTVITAVRRGAADGGDHFSQATPSPSRSSPAR